MRKLAIVVALLASLSAAAGAQEAAPAGAGAPEEAPATGGQVRIRGGYVSGLQYMDMNWLEKGAYVSGLVEGMLLAPAFGAPEANMTWFYDCTRALGLKALRKALFAYVKERDALWPNRNPAKVYRAIHAACVERAAAAAKEAGAAPESPE